MFLRVVRATVSKGVKREYVRVVEAYRDRDGKTRHRTVINLGRKDLLAEHLDFGKLRRLLHGDAAGDDRVAHKDIGAVGAWDWGPLLAARRMWSDLGLDTTLDQLARPDRREAVRLSDRALVLVANRLTAPASEHALAQWLESDFVCDRCGRRFIAAWRDDAERQASRTPRVRVALRQLKQWYRTLDQLLEHKAETEHALFITLRDLFSLQVDMVFYDLTSTYFEGRGPPEIGAHGHSRDGKPRNPQVLVGLVLVDGWPIAHHVFEGNRRDAKTVPDVLRDLEQRFGLKRIVFVGDRGMVTSQNLEDLRGNGHGLWAAIAAAVVRCLTISKARPAPGSNVRSASRPARRRHRPRRWFRRLSHKNQACGCSWCTPKSAWRMSAPSASRPWIACAHGSKSCSGASTTAGSRRPRKSALPRPACSPKIMATAIMTGPTTTACFASSSIPSTSRASRLTRANTSFKPKSPICPQSTRCASTKNFPKSNVPSPTSRMSSTCGRSIIRQ